MIIRLPTRQRPPWSAPRGMRGSVADTPCALTACERTKPETMTDDGSLYRINGKVYTYSELRDATLAEVADPFRRPGRDGKFDFDDYLIESLQIGIIETIGEDDRDDASSLLRLGGVVPRGFVSCRSMTSRPTIAERLAPSGSGYQPAGCRALDCISRWAGADSFALQFFHLPATSAAACCSTGVAAMAPSMTDGSKSSSATVSGRY